jgi:hypothetical protein
MRQFIIAAAMLAAAMLSTSLALADRDNGHGNGGVGNGRGNGNEKHEYHGAPGPILGAGLPVLAIGYGVYWLVKRRRRTD